MRILGRPLLDKFVLKHPATRSWLMDWVRAAQGAQWHNLMEVRQQHPSADGVRTQNNTIVTVFNVKGNEYRLLTRLVYRDQTAEVLELLTHAEYDKAGWKRRL